MRDTQTPTRPAPTTDALRAVSNGRRAAYVEAAGRVTQRLTPRRSGILAPVTQPAASVAEASVSSQPPPVPDEARPLATARQLEHALQTVGVGVATLGADGALRRVTASLRDMVQEWADVDTWWEDVRRHLDLGVGATALGTLDGSALADLSAPGGRRRVFEITHAPDDGGASSGLVLVRDATSQVRFEETLRESEQRYALAARAANDGLWDWDLRTGHVYYSPRWRAMLGLSREELPPNADAWLGRIHPEDLDGLQTAIQSHLAGATEHFEHEYRILERSGVYRWVLSRGIAVRGPGGVAVRMAGSQTDITERRRAEEKLRHDALYDGLTGLPNRVLFMDVLARAMRRQRRDEAYGFAVIFLDLDRFKLVNDSLGHHAGDVLLRGFAERLQACVRLNDTVARLGGDEFTILLEDTTSFDETEIVAERIMRSLDEPFDLDGERIYTSTSIGVAMSDAEYEHPQAILRDADTAMYRAKASGKNRVAFFDRAMHRRARTLLELHTDLRHAVERNELELQYQPIVDLGDRRLRGFEALVRWRHSERGMIWPDEFIPVAEENGLIVPLGDWVLEEACRQTLTWQQAFPEASGLHIAVNLSGKAIADPNLPERVAAILNRVGLAPQSLHLEVTESAVMSNLGDAADVIAGLKELGAQIHIDDFGTGYSSLSYLQRFAVDGVKIDRSFVTKIGEEDGPDPIVRAIAGLAAGMGLDVVAEGIQTHRQAEQLRALGCQFGQGYLYARPLDPAYARTLIADGGDFEPA